MRLKPFLSITLTLLLVTQLQTIAAKEEEGSEEDGSGLDDNNNDTEKDDVATLNPCKTNTDCAKYKENESSEEVFYSFSYCNSGQCACLEGREWRKDKCKCTEDGKKQEIGGCKKDKSVTGACNKLQCFGDNSACTQIEGGAYCKCPVNYSGAYCEISTDPNPVNPSPDTNQKTPKIIPTKAPNQNENPDDASDDDNNTNSNDNSSKGKTSDDDSKNSGTGLKTLHIVGIVIAILVFVVIIGVGYKFCYKKDTSTRGMEMS